MSPGLPWNESYVTSQTGASSSGSHPPSQQANCTSANSNSLTVHTFTFTSGSTAAAPAPALLAEPGAPSPFSQVNPAPTILGHDNPLSLSNAHFLSLHPSSITSVPSVNPSLRPCLFPNPHHSLPTIVSSNLQAFQLLNPNHHQIPNQHHPLNSLTPNQYHSLISLAQNQHHHQSASLLLMPPILSPPATNSAVSSPGSAPPNFGSGTANFGSGFSPLSPAAGLTTTPAGSSLAAAAKSRAIAQLSGVDPLTFAALLRARGKVLDALLLYESVLSENPGNVEALVGKGMCLQSQNMNRQAFETYVMALTVDPRSAVALTQCGVLYKEEGHLLEAIETFRKALENDSTNKEAAEQLAVSLTDLGTRLKLAGSLQEGISKYYEAISIDPKYAPVHYNLGVVFSEMGQYNAAISFYEKSVQLRPLYAEAHCNMGVIYKNCGDLLSAVTCYERCLSVAPNFTIAKNNMAIALTDLGTKVKLEGDIQQGVAYYKKALLYNATYADAMYNLGVAYGELLKFDAAIVMYELALHFNPQCAEACNNLGVIYKDRDNLEKAEDCYQKALRIKPNFSQSLNNLGVVYTVQGKMDLALSMIQSAIIANPSYAEAYNNLGVLHRDAGNIPAAIEAYEQCLKIDPDSRNAGQNRLLAMNYINEGDDDKLYCAHRDWGRRFSRLFTEHLDWSKVSKIKERKLVIGYVSPDYFTHSVSYFIEAPLTYHDSDKVKIIVYSAVVKADSKTLRFKDVVMKKGGEWKEIYGLDEKKAAALAREDKVDILVELTGHTANNKLGMMACRGAPIQVTWIGYPNTAGLPAIDYRFSDGLADPVDTQQKHVEELVRLPGCFLCYTPSTEAGPVSPSPALSNGFVTFGSFNNLAKITPRVVRLWAHILRLIPNSRLVVKCKPFSCPSISERFMSVLESEGVDSVRVDLMPLILLNHDHMQSYSLMDISLDTFPYAGTTTTCESLYMGVPCVTMAGSVHAHNVGVTLLTQLNLPELIAHTEEEYIRKAFELASDIPKLAQLRAGIRDRMLNSRLCDGKNFTRGLEEVYRTLWHRYCDGVLPDSSNDKNEKGKLRAELSPMVITRESGEVKSTSVGSMKGVGESGSLCSASSGDPTTLSGKGAPCSGKPGPSSLPPSEGAKNEGKSIIVHGGKESSKALRPSEMNDGSIVAGKSTASNGSSSKSGAVGNVSKGSSEQMCVKEEEVSIPSSSKG